MSSKITIISHNDLDGLGAVYILENYLREQNNQNIIVWIASSPVQVRTQFIKKSDTIYVTDLELSEEQLDNLRTKTDNLIIIDHHGEDDGKPCATKQVQERFYPDNGHFATFAKYVDIYDRWLDTSVSPEEWQTAMDYNANYWVQMKYQSLGEIKNNHKPMEKYDSPTKPYSYKQIIQHITEINPRRTKIFYDIIEEQLQESLKKYKILTDTNNNKLCFVPRQTETSLVSNRLLKALPEVRYVILYKSTNVSVRSRNSDDFDVRTIPGIGGHQQSGGGQLTKELLDFIGLDKV